MIIYAIIVYYMDTSITILTPEQEQFVINYTTKGDFYSNGVLSYANAYGYALNYREDGKPDSKDNDYSTCNACASRLLQKDNIKARIQEIYLSMWNENAVDARVSEILHKGQEANSIQAVKIFNDLKQRITKKIDLTSGGRPLGGLTDEELDNLAKE